jgi:hypothetical protein
MKNVFNVFREVYATDKKEFFGSIAFVIVWAGLFYVLLTLGSID